MNFLVKSCVWKSKKEAIRKEKDDISKKRVAEINTELDTLREQENEMKESLE